eukprot:TRINITY_DN7721_c1_g1_i4.p2 TRINITY_DN7721_c1_g1~~TRINITY_DN7721_c1_g1_i4.p2  ORF type:complete len:101 (+),score=5.13 TRINITY_DN7721_c1_g1_i4:225-527(+)
MQLVPSKKEKKKRKEKKLFFLFFFFLLVRTTDISQNAAGQKKVNECGKTLSSSGSLLCWARWEFAPLLVLVPSSSRTGVCVHKNTTIVPPAAQNAFQFFV